MESKWVKFPGHLSWHVIRDETTTYCGRVWSAEDEQADMFDANEKTCEICLRTMALEDEDAD